MAHLSQRLNFCAVTATVRLLTGLEWPRLFLLAALAAYGKPDKPKDCRSEQWPVSRNIGPIVDVVRYRLGSLHLEHIAKKLRDFSIGTCSNSLNLSDSFSIR